jgi:hypothetical protein
VDEGRGFVDLVPGSPYYGTAVAVNNDGLIAGSQATDGALQAVVWKVTPAGPVDANADGIVDTLQPSGTSTGSFTDSTIVPPTYGSISARDPGVSVTVTDADAPDGVTVVVSGTAGRATLSMCGGAFTVRLNAGSSAILTCGSIRMKTLTGEADVVLAGGITTVAVPAPSIARVSDSGGGRYAVQNLGTTPVTVTTSGVSTTVRGGSTSTVAVVTIANVCSLATTYVKGSAKYAALTARARNPVDALAATVCTRLAKIGPKLTAKQRAAFLADYRTAVNALSSSGWITPDRQPT